MRQINDISYASGTCPAWKLDLYLPDLSAMPKPNRVFLYLHGGGLEGGDKKDASTWGRGTDLSGNRRSFS